LRSLRLGVDQLISNAQTIESFKRSLVNILKIGYCIYVSIGNDMTAS
jgi:hypothetical protein